MFFNVGAKLVQVLSSRLPGFCSFLVLVAIDTHSQAGVSHNLMSPKLLALEGLQNDCVQPWFQGSEKLFVMLISSQISF